MTEEICLTDEEYNNLINEIINPNDLRCKTEIVESKGRKDYYLTLNSGPKIYLGSNIQGFLTPNQNPNNQKGASSQPVPGMGGKRKENNNKSKKNKSKKNRKRKNNRKSKKNIKRKC
tara:strand:+ start:127 stop:477 length:351 start_codon:yes stop_codon:yes gene_type:complete